MKVNYQVVDPSVEAAQARLEAMRHGKFMKIKLRKKKTSPEESLDKSFGKFNFHSLLIFIKVCNVSNLYVYMQCNVI